MKTGVPSRWAAVRECCSSSYSNSKVASCEQSPKPATFVRKGTKTSSRRRLAGERRRFESTPGQKVLEFLHCSSNFVVSEVRPSFKRYPSANTSWLASTFEVKSDNIHSQ